MPRRAKTVEVPERCTERRIRVVTGSRSLEDHSQRSNAETFLVLHLGDLGPNDIIIDGGATGPDTWAYNIGLAIGCKTIRFFPDGRMQSPKGKIGSWRSEIREPRVWEDYKERNWAMLSALQGTPGDVAVIALIDHDSPTRGASATLNEAVRRKIPYKKWTTTDESLCASTTRTMDRRSYG